MALYEYRCPDCKAEHVSQTRGPSIYAKCAQCGEYKNLKRRWSLAFKHVLHSHYNETTGTMISDHKQFARELSAASDKAEERTGIPHKFVPREG